MKQPSNPILLLVLACIAIFFTNLDALHVNIMEARNFISAREMLQDGNWIFTTINGQPRYQKPPLPTWITAFFAASFGLKNVIAMRLPAACMALLLALTSYRFSKSLTQNKALAFTAALVMTTSFLIVFAGRNGQWDIYTHAFMLACGYQLFLLFTTEKKTYRHALWAGLFFGCSFMSKGPVAFYTLLLPMLISFGFVYRFNRLRSQWQSLLLFVGIAALLSLSWYAYVYWSDTTNFLAVTKREAINWTHYNLRPFYYYWDFFTQSGAWTILAFIGLLYPYLKDRVMDKQAYTFTCIWTVLSLLLLSIIPEKKTRYLLPVLIPLALNTAFYLEYLFRRFKTLTDKRETVPVYFNFGLIAVMGILVPLGGYIYLKAYSHSLGQENVLAGNWHWYILLTGSLFIIGVLMLRKLIQKEIQSVFYLTIIFIASIMCFGMPLAKVVENNPNYKPLSDVHHWKASTQRNVYEYSVISIEMVWNYGEKLPVIKREGAITIPSETSFGVLVSKEQKAHFLKTFRGYSAEKIMRYDMNTNPEGMGSHRTRLWRDLYLVNRISP